MSSWVAEFKDSHREHRGESRKLQSQIHPVQDLVFFSGVLIMVSQMVSNIICWSTNSIQALAIMFELTNRWFSRLQASLIQAFL